MKKQTFLLTFLFIFAITACVQAQVTQTRSVGNFSGIKVCCGVKVYLTEGSSTEVRVEASSNVIDRVVPKVKGGVLDISIEKKNESKSAGGAKVYVTAKDLNRLEASSAANIVGKNTINARDIRLEASSGSSMNIDLRADNITGSVNSGSSLNVAGTASSAKISAGSGGSAKMKGLTVSKANVSSSSGGSLNITVKDELNASASSGGSVTYYGNPVKNNRSVNSGGSVKGK